MTDNFFEPPAWSLDAADRVAPEAADRLRMWWSERGFTPEVLETLIADPQSAESFRERLARGIRKQRQLRYAAT